MQQPVTRCTSRARRSPLGVDQLEDRQVLSGLTPLFDSPLPAPAVEASALLALLQPSGTDQASGDPAHEAEALAAALFTVADAGRPEAAQAVVLAINTLRDDASHGVRPGPGSARADGGQAGVLLSALAGERLVASHGSGGDASGVSGGAGTVAAERSLPPTVGPRAPAWPEVGVAVQDYVAGWPVARGPAPVIPPSLVVLERALWRDLRGARYEQAGSPQAVPAREGDAASPAAASLAPQYQTVMPRPDAVAEPERAGAAFTTLLLVPAGARGDAWLSGVPADGAGDMPAEPGETARLVVHPLPASQAAAAEAGATLPEAAWLAAGFLSLNTAALEQAVARFLDGLGAAGRDLTRDLAGNPLARWAAVVAATALAAEWGRRRVRRESACGDAEDEQTATFNSPPGSSPFRPGDAI